MIINISKGENEIVPGIKDIVEIVPIGTSETLAVTLKNLKDMHKYLKIIIFCLLLTSIYCERLFSQNTFISSISTNLVGIAFNDISIFYERTKKDTSKFGFSLGYMVAGRWIKSGGIEINDDKNPIQAYNGPEFRLFYMNPLNKKKQNKYIGIEFLFKYLYYNNTTFLDYCDVGENEPVYFTRNEKTFVYGLEWKLCKDFYNKGFFTQVFWGFGVRLKTRDINTTKTVSEGLDYFRPEGKQHRTAMTPTINFGVKIGGNVKRK